MLSQNQIEHCKGLLKERQSILIQQSEEKNDRSLMLTEIGGELSSYDNHPADIGTALYDRSKDQALERHAEKELEQINEALHAIEEGTYGLCAVCGDDIGFERLEAVPMAAHCKEHAEQESENENNGDAHTFEPNLGLIDHAFEVFEDDGRENAWSAVSAYGTSTSTHTEVEDDEDSYDSL